MRRMILVLAVVSASVSLALAAGVGSAAAQGSVVGPGESIQKAVNAAHPGDTIIVRGVHREDVIIRKNGIKLLGQDAVIQAPPKSKADSTCSKVSEQPIGICVLGGEDLKAVKLVGPRVSDVSISGFTLRGFTKAPSICLCGTRDSTATKNRAMDGGFIAAEFSVGTKIISNVMRGPGASGIGLHKGRNITVAGNEVTGSSDAALTLEDGPINVTVEGNHFMDNTFGMLMFDSTGTKIVSNHVSHSDILGIYMQGPKRANNAKIVGNHVSGGGWGIFVTNAHGGSIVRNKVHDNCAGMFFEAFKNQPVGDYEVKANTLADNTRSCGGQKFGRKFSGIGIALLGASNMEVTANHFWGNVPTGPTPISGGVVVSKDPYFQDTNFAGTQKPKDNSVIANYFGRNKPDIFWDRSGSGNQFRANLCDTSVPSSLCK